MTCRVPFSIRLAPETAIRVALAPSQLPLRALVTLGVLLLCGACATATPAPTQDPSAPSAAGERAAQSASAATVTSVSSTEKPRPEVALRHPRGNQPWLGVELAARSGEAPGVSVARVIPGSPAQAAGLESGDVLLRIGERSVSEPKDVLDAVGGSGLDQSVPVALLRSGNHRLIRVQLLGRPDFEDLLRLAFVGRSAPEISGVVTFQGEVASLGELEGQVVVLEFWASWCGVCRYLAPVLDDMHRDFRPRGLTVFGITSDPPKLGSRVASDAGMSYPLASDPGGAATRRYMASQVPAVFVIDRSGVVRDVFVGVSPRTVTQMRGLIEELLAGHET